MVPRPVPAVPAWLLDGDELFRPADHFAVQVIYATGKTPRDRLEAARSYRRQWGDDGLRQALRIAGEVGPLPDELAEVFRLLTTPARQAAS